MKTFAERWQEYKKMTVPATASSTQIQDMQSAFYAGALSMFFTFLEFGEREDSEADFLAIKELENELHEYFKNRIAELGIISAMQLINREENENGRT